MYDTNSVQDRIRQWQVQGGGVVHADDIGEDDDENEEKPAKRRTRKREDRVHSKNEHGSHSSRMPSRSGRRTIQADDEGKGRSRSGSAPAKRILSDSHWRKAIGHPDTAISPKFANEATSPKTAMNDGIRAISVSKSKDEIRQTKTVTPEGESVCDDNGIRVYVTPPGSHRRSERSRRQRRSEHSLGEPGSGSARKLDHADPSAGSQGRKKASIQDAPARTSSFGLIDASRRRRSSVQKTMDSNNSQASPIGGISNDRSGVKLRKVNFINQVLGDSKQRHAKQAPDTIPSSRLPSIEAWLSDTPDPFADPEEPPLGAIPPLNLSSRKEPSPKTKGCALRKTSIADTNKIWEALNTKDGTRRTISGSNRKTRIASSAIYEDNPFPEDFDSESAISGSGRGSTSASKFVDLVHDDTKSSPSSLKRRKARKSVSSPLRERRRAQSIKEADEAEDSHSALSSNQTESSVEGPNSIDLQKRSELNTMRPSPSTGNHELSTIASVETLSTKQNAAPASKYTVSKHRTQPPTAAENKAHAESRDTFDPDSLRRNTSRLTKHADLMSVLSLPQAGSRSIRSARSIRTNRSRLATATIPDLMQELTTDEEKYMRELRTLVDGVIPVLLTCVLSKSDSAVAASLFQAPGNGNEDPNFTRPIIDMGIALERLKKLHARIPREDTNGLITWAHGAQRVYAEYLKAWRMGFQNVVVNLAPAAEITTSSSLNAKTGLENILPRNENGDIVNGDGERVDVAFLLKRPLVRLKYLAKTLKGINFVRPSTEAESLATKYQKLVENARQRSNEERARLEDEAASNIDPTRARDLKTLAPLNGVSIERARRVRARDHFNLALKHSSGQCIDCRVELLLRDDATGQLEGGDLLICEVDESGRWLLFPPVEFTKVSARNGDLKGEIIVMIRGSSSEWQEMLSLRSEDEQAGFEWVQMLGLKPVPPRISRSQSFVIKHHKIKQDLAEVSSGVGSAIVPSRPEKSRTPSPSEVEVPIGEQAKDTSKTWQEKPQRSHASGALSVLPKTPEQVRKPLLLDSQGPHSKSTNYVDQVSDLRSLPSQIRHHESSQIAPITREASRPPRSFKEALGLSGTSTTIGLKRAQAKRRSRNVAGSPTSPRSQDGAHKEKRHSDLFSTSPSAWKPLRLNGSSKDLRASSPKPNNEYVVNGSEQSEEHNTDARPGYHRSTSSVPSMELPYIPKARKDSPPITPLAEVDEEPQWPAPSDGIAKSTSSKLIKRRSISSRSGSPQELSPPAPPAHHSPTPSVQLDLDNTSVLTKNKVKPRRSSSPLKHEYEPSATSDSSSDSETSTIARHDATSVSDSSDDEELEDEDVPTPLLPLGALKCVSSARPPPKMTVQPTLANTIKPSESASQAPFRAVPPQPKKAAKTIASIFSWSGTGSWQSLHPDECSIVITPGLIEAFHMSAAHSNFVPPSSSKPVEDVDAFSDIASNLTSQNDEVQGDRPLVALELTPLVPLRRGTALDISIRSPPTPRSQITSGNNIMFRSRNPEECEALYALINHSRINNPTYIALQNARPAPGSFAGDRRAASSASRHSWFGGWARSSSYRASSAPTPSIAPTESSVGSMFSAFSALKRFGRGNGIFNISLSTITSREGSRAGSIYSSSDNSSGSGTSTPVPPGMISAGREAPIGLSNAKIRLYLRETQSKWRDMGSARLTIMRPDRSNTNIGPDGRPTSAGTGAGSHQGRNNEKRIVINGKTKREVLLDVVLGENCFERIARTGIALSVWEDVVGPNGEVGVVAAQGGVVGGRATVYMIQVRPRCFILEDFRHD